MIAKALELRDRGTFIPLLAVEMRPSGAGWASQAWLLRRAGYGEPRCILITAMAGGRRSEYDPHSWGDRTFRVAHHHIEQNWDSLRDGDVVCVEHILGERAEPKRSERHGAE